MRKLLIIIVLAAITPLAVLTGCSNVGCTENRNSIPIAGFYSYRTLDPIVIDSLAIGGVGAPADTLLLRPNGNAGQVYLPFRATANETQFYIKYQRKELDYPELYDTLSFTYTSVPYFASEDCGAMYHYNITRLDYTTHLIDSVGIVDSLITNLERETIRIFFRTADPDESDDPNEPDEPETPDENL